MCVLQQCGILTEWKRVPEPMTDPPTLKPFGFCDYSDVRGVIKAMRIMNGLKIENMNTGLIVSALRGKLVTDWVTGEDRRQGARNCECV